MPAINCGICSKFVGAEDQLRLCAYTTHAFHTRCVLKKLGVPSMSALPPGQTPSCYACSKIKSGTTSTSSSGTATISSRENGNNLVAKIESLTSLLTALSGKVDNLEGAFNDIQLIKSQVIGICDLKTGVGSCLTKLTDLTSKLTTVEESLSRLSESNVELTSRIQSNEASIAALEANCNRRLALLEETIARDTPSVSDTSAAVQPLAARVRQLELGTQNALITVSGIPELEQIDDLDTTAALFTYLGSDAKRSHIVEVSRMRTTRAVNQPRTLLVRLCSSTIRNSVLRAKRSKGVVQANEINAAFPSCNVYINEFLPAEVHKLLQATRLAAKERGYRYVWVRNGEIKVRKDSQAVALDICAASDIETKMI